MTEEEHNLLVENNQTLRYICSYLYYQQYHSSSNDIKDFMMNVIANKYSSQWEKNMNVLLKVIKEELLKIVDNIDTGNSNISEEECNSIISTLKAFTEKDIPMSKYQAFNYLHISRATFDNLVRESKIPQGKKQQGFNELQWFKKDLDTYRENKFKHK